MKLIVMSCLALGACATSQVPAPLVALAQARATYTSVCGEAVRLAKAGQDGLTSALQACVHADDILDAADVAYSVGKMAQATSGANQALVYITAAQVAIAALRKVK